MKKLKTFLFAIIIITGISYSQSFKVTSPSGKIWFKGKPYNIKWASSGISNGVVKIRLFNEQGTQKLLEITNGTPDNGSFPWTVPSNFTSGYYTIRVKTLDNKVSGNSVKFRISGKLSYQGRGKALTPSRTKAVNTRTGNYPDLVIAGFRQSQIFIQGSVKVAGAIEKIPVLVRNIGKVNANIKANSTILEADINGRQIVHSLTGNMTLAPGQSYKFFIRIFQDMKRGLAVGQHPITIMVDPKNVIKESREDNNKKSGRFLIKRPDLLISNISLKAPPLFQSQYYIVVTIKNNGNLFANFSKHFLKLSASEDRNIYAIGSLPLLAGKSQKITLRVKPKIGRVFKLTLKVDPENAIDESNDNNNTKSAVFNLR